jgi:hypothetical protein
VYVNIGAGLDRAAPDCRQPPSCFFAWPGGSGRWQSFAPEAMHFTHVRIPLACSRLNLDMVRSRSVGVMCFQDDFHELSWPGLGPCAHDGGPWPASPEGRSESLSPRSL